MDEPSDFLKQEMLLAWAPRLTNSRSFGPAGFDLCVYFGGRFVEPGSGTDKFRPRVGAALVANLLGRDDDAVPVGGKAQQVAFPAAGGFHHFRG